MAALRAYQPWSPARRSRLGTFGSVVSRTVEDADTETIYDDGTAISTPSGTASAWVELEQAASANATWDAITALELGDDSEFWGDLLVDAPDRRAVLADQLRRSGGRHVDGEAIGAAFGRLSLLDRFAALNATDDLVTGVVLAPTLRADLIHSLGFMADRETHKIRTEMLRRYLADQRWLLRAAAVEAIGCLGDHGLARDLRAASAREADASLRALMSTTAEDLVAE